MAEQIALNEKLNSPQEKHYKKAFSLLRLTKELNPRGFEKIVSIGAIGKEMKDEMGATLYKTFDEVWKDCTRGFGRNIIEVKSRLVNENPKIPLDELSNELSVFYNSYLNAKAEVLKKDPRILSSFKGKEELLNKVLKTSITSISTAFLDNWRNF